MCLAGIARQLSEGWLVVCLVFQHSNIAPATVQVASMMTGMLLRPLGFAGVTASQSLLFTFSQMRVLSEFHGDAIFDIVCWNFQNFCTAKKANQKRKQTKPQLNYKIDMAKSRYGPVYFVFVIYFFDYSYRGDCMIKQNDFL